MADQYISELNSSTPVAIVSGDLAAIERGGAEYPGTLGAAAGMDPRTYIQGLLVTKSSDTAIAISAGECWDETNGAVISYAGGTVSPSLAASKQYTVYVYDSGGGATVDVQQEDPPSSAYAGTARKRASGNGGRFAGWFLTDASAHVIDIDVRESAQNQVMVRHKTDTSAAPFRVLSAGTDSAYGSEVSLLGVVPRYVTVEMFAVVVITAGGVGAVESFIASTDGVNNNAGRLSLFCAASTFSQASMAITVDAAMPGFYYFIDVAGGSAYVDVYGHTYAR